MSDPKADQLEALNQGLEDVKRGVSLYVKEIEDLQALCESYLALCRRKDNEIQTLRSLINRALSVARDTGSATQVQFYIEEALKKC